MTPTTLFWPPFPDECDVTGSASLWVTASILSSRRTTLQKAGSRTDTSKLLRFPNGYPGRIFYLVTPDGRRRPRRFGTDGDYPKFERGLLAKPAIHRHHSPRCKAGNNKIILHFPDRIRSIIP